MMNDSESLVPQIDFSRLPIVKANQDTNATSVFISYSQSQDKTGDHRKWVAMLARKISGLGINVDFDSNVDGHESFCDYMGKISEATFVICICSACYVKKADDASNRTGVRWEIEQIAARGRNKQNLPSFLIPIIKDGLCATHPNNLPLLISEHDIPSWNFESQDEAKINFAKIIARILDINKILNEKLTSKELYQKYAQTISDFFHNKVAQYWCADLNSKEEKEHQLLIVSGDVFKIPEESSTKASSINDFDARHGEKAIVGIGKWDMSHDGDKEILSFLTGGSDNE